MCATRGFASSAASVVTTRGAAATFAARAATVGSVFAASAAFVTAVKLNDVEAIPQAKAAVPKASAPSNSNLPPPSLVTIVTETFERLDIPMK